MTMIGLPDSATLLGAFVVASLVLAVPVVKGRKSARERFAGAVDTIARGRQPDR